MLFTIMEWSLCTRHSSWMQHIYSCTCLQDWRLLHKAGLVTAAEHVSSPQVAALQSWAEAAYADLTLMHALHGKPLGPHQSVAELLPQVVEPRRMGDGMETFLIR